MPSKKFCNPEVAAREFTAVMLILVLAGCGGSRSEDELPDLYR